MFNNSLHETVFSYVDIESKINHVDETVVWVEHFQEHRHEKIYARVLL